MSGCLACERIEMAGRGENPWFIAELRESVVVLHDHQAYPGWCVLLLKGHVEHLHLLSRERQRGLAEDVADVAGAVVRAFSPARVNYECLGNQLAHVHWHVIPRYAPPRDPDPKSVVWVRPEAELGRETAPEERLEAIRRLRAAGLGFGA